MVIRSKADAASCQFLSWLSGKPKLRIVCVSTDASFGVGIGIGIEAPHAHFIDTDTDSDPDADKKAESSNLVFRITTIAILYVFVAFYEIIDNDLG